MTFNAGEFTVRTERTFNDDIGFGDIWKEFVEAIFPDFVAFW